ncbi:hypothetical protein GGR53DRAFT_525471 [Hypoxylon sp. FL1150]|nr:hypothetical protein GGR53DRAFT_525471 [Hypoxylon sp. FL1150]
MVQQGVAEIEGVGLFFGCGHNFVKLTKTPLAETLRDTARNLPLCPYCRGGKRCLNCNDLFWGYSCDTCDKFESVEAFADHFLLLGTKNIHFREGMILINNPSEELTKIPGGADSVVSARGIVGCHISAYLTKLNSHI